ncbi:MAG: homoserine kinase [Reinekea sp.]
MSVYTELNSEEIRAFLARYTLGDYVSHQGISAGVENTNYFVTTSEHKLVLTLFEKHHKEELPFFFRLAEHLFNEHCKVPQPFRADNGLFIQELKGKPAVFNERLHGNHVEANLSTANTIAEALAAIHNSTEHFRATHPHSHGRRWIQAQAVNIMPQLVSEDQALLKQALALINDIPADLPSGIIHADLFHDNALFDGDEISGIIDWYFAGHDYYALDLAITMNDWCLDKDGRFDQSRGAAFVAHYQQFRPLTDIEKHYLPSCQVQSATRFWLSRWLAKAIHQDSTDQITVKDPELMKQLLTQLIDYT